MSNLLKTIFNLIFALLFGNSEQTASVTQETNAIVVPDNPTRPNKDSDGQNVGEVEITDFMFNDLSRTGYSLSRGIPNIWIKTKAKVAGVVDFTVYVDGNKDSINNPEGKSATYTLGEEKKVILELPNGPSARELGAHNVTIRQSYNSGRDNTTGEIHTVYASKTFAYEVIE